MSVIVVDLTRAREYAEQLRENPPALTDLQASRLRDLVGTVKRAA